MTTVDLRLGDCLEVLPTLGAGSVDAVITDPPYSTGGAFRADRTQPTDVKYQMSEETNRTYAAFAGDNRDQRSYERWSRMWMDDCLRITREGGILASFIDWRNLSSVIDAVQVAGWVYRGIIPWHKGDDQRPRKGWVRANVEYMVMASNGPMHTGHTAPGLCENGILYIRNDSNEKYHQTGKPVEVAERIIKMRADIKTVVDPFMGSGTTGVACVKLGINFIGIEKDAGYFAIAQRRIAEAQAQLTLPLFAEVAQ